MARYGNFKSVEEFQKFLEKVDSEAKKVLVNAMGKSVNCFDIKPFQEIIEEFKKSEKDVEKIKELGKQINDIKSHIENELFALTNQWHQCCLTKFTNAGVGDPYGATTKSYMGFGTVSYRSVWGGVEGIIRCFIDAAEYCKNHSGKMDGCNKIPNNDDVKKLQDKVGSLKEDMLGHCNYCRSLFSNAIIEQMQISPTEDKLEKEEKKEEKAEQEDKLKLYQKALGKFADSMDKMLSKNNSSLRGMYEDIWKNLYSLYDSDKTIDDFKKSKEKISNMCLEAKQMHNAQHKEVRGTFSHLQEIDDKGVSNMIDRIDKILKELGNMEAGLVNTIVDYFKHCDDLTKGLRSADKRKKISELSESRPNFKKESDSIEFNTRKLISEKGQTNTEKKFSKLYKEYLLIYNGLKATGKAYQRNPVNRKA